MENQEEFLKSEDYCILDDIGLWSKNIAHNDYYGPRAKCFSKMLQCMNIYLYDHPVLIEKQPYGFFTDNIAFIPTTMYDRMKDCEPLTIKTNDINSYWNLTGLIFIPLLTQMIEKKYEVNFSNEEKNKILMDAIEHTFKPRGLIVNSHTLFYSDNVKLRDMISDKEFSKDLREKTEDLTFLYQIEKQFIEKSIDTIWMNNSAAFLSKQEVINLAKEAGIEKVRMEGLNRLTNNTGFLDYALLKTTDIYETNSPLNSLIKKITYPSNKIDLLNIDIEEYKKFICDPFVTNKFEIFAAFESLSHHIVKESKSEEDILRYISGIWCNLALQLNDSDFEPVLDILYEHIAEKNGILDKNFNNKKTLPNNLVEKIARTIVENSECYNNKRQMLISGITKEPDMTATVRTNIFFKNSPKKTLS